MSAIIQKPAAPAAINPFLPQTPQDAWNLARTLATSSFLPEHLKKGGPEVATANVFAILAVAHEANVNPIMLMQHVHVVSGKVGYSAQYLIGRANMSGKFLNGIEFTVEGDPAKPDTLAVTASAVRRDGVVLPGVCITMRQAKTAGWAKNAKYDEIPVQMLSYRAAAFFIRLNCPEVVIGGGQTAEELQDAVAAGTLTDVTPAALPAAVETRAASKAPVVAQEPGESLEDVRARVEREIKDASGRQAAVAVAVAAKDHVDPDALKQWINAYHPAAPAAPKQPEAAPESEQTDAPVSEADAKAKLREALVADLTQRVRDGKADEGDVFAELESSGLYSTKEAGRAMVEIKKASGVQ